MKKLAVVLGVFTLLATSNLYASGNCASRSKETRFQTASYQHLMPGGASVKSNTAVRKSVPTKAADGVKRGT